ncbi:MAG: hypothetical protein CMI52_04490 [Parcubacteria group bacterium]|nr:hypothetical protein [Parcubacteria group bacterium]
MYIIVKGPFTENMHVLMQHVGYGAHRSPEEISYTRRTGGDRYPRFHVYPEMQGENIRVNLHLDMKKHSYEGFSRHQGEYEGKTVQREMDRIQVFLESKTRAAQQEKKEEKKKGGFFGGFGR